MKQIITPEIETGKVILDKGLLAENFGMSVLDLSEAIFEFGMKQLWLASKESAHGGPVTDAHLIQACARHLKFKKVTLQ
jgi:hypothetical protein